MLEETRLDYALVTVFVEVWISIGSCRRLLLDDGRPGSYRFVFRVSTDKRACIDQRTNFAVVDYSETGRTRGARVQYEVKRIRSVYCSDVASVAGRENGRWVL